ncbi:tryptophan synthase subunit alpha [Ketobacter sp. MCCC 1A13808]|uniref:tryptophan synthase subunit alpha n=1 Tax=Ketobacter sp. MCCC 1A13808 TaxID=2602738 RepID=UPI000F22B4E5|nr:tryptophan synthase subunit alpha [Ketobacter sp. MCCC 1A13808]MVF12462.1 tryptophan synthase subunit alpha [Ketobacter sp. MCCC 1A13808]RLP55727.1 MAG: tryptophan synthase subunit alpha [Ketobacter sp.]
MSRIKACLQNLKQQNKKALIPFITAGDPNLKATVPLMLQLVESGADIIELGVPFSDPMADGPVIQLADERALEQGTTITHVLEMVAEFRASNQTTPVVLMGYLNPIEVTGYETFAEAAAAAGVDGLITVDLPVEAAAGPVEIFDKAGIESIFLIAPTTSDKRIAKIAAMGRGYLYYVSLKGVTGAGNLDVDAVNQKLETIRKITDLPIAVGFGIKDAETARSIGRNADGVVVGSALVNLIANNQNDAQTMLTQVGGFIQSLRSGLDQ